MCLLITVGSRILESPSFGPALFCVGFIFLFVFFYLWLRWVFVAVCRPSPVAAGGGFSRCSAGLSFQWLLLLWGTGSRVL